MTSHLAAGGTEAIDKYQLIAITGNHHFAIKKCVCIYIYMYLYLVGGIPTPLKNMKVKCDDYSQYIYIYGKIKNVPNHQPNICIHIYIYIVLMFCGFS